MTKGVVYIIGAGPGSADLITLRGLRAIKAANVIIIDSLLPENFLDTLGVNSSDKEIHCLKEDGVRMSQERINRLMLEAATAGKIVARVKTGDPHIFGRGLEEQVFLSENGILWEYIPGISVLSGGTGLADMPLTKRETARSFAVVSARCSGGRLNTDFPKADSLVIFMGVSVIDAVAQALFSQGWDKDAPAAILERGCMPFERLFFSTLDSIAAVAAANRVEAPAVLVVGSAAQRCDFEGKRPRILFTGLDPDNFRILGRLIHWPVIEIKRNEAAYESLPEIFAKLSEGYFKYVVITSKVSAKLFLNALADADFDNRIFSHSKIVVAGRGTAELLRENGINADFVPEQYGSKGILEKTAALESGNVLVVQSATASEAMANSISQRLGDVTHLKLHQTAPMPHLPESLPQCDVVYFTCPSAVRAYYEKYGKGGFTNKVWCIGDVTQKQLEKFDIESEVVIPYVS